MRISDWSSDVCSSDLGFDPDAFWRQTPRSYQSAMRGAAIRARIDGEKDIALEHTIASFSRAKKLERLDHYLRPRGRSKATMLHRLKALSDRVRQQGSQTSYWPGTPQGSGRGLKRGKEAGGE